MRADVAIVEGQIAEVGPSLSAREEIDATGLLVLPGVIDAHTHMQASAGGGMSADDFRSGSTAAAAGGVTTLIDFTVSSPDSSLPEDIERRKLVAQDSIVDVALHAEVTCWRPGRDDEIREAVATGVTSFKFYMAYGSLGQRSDSGALFQAFRQIAECGGVAMVHAEDDPMIDSLLERMTDRDRASMASLPRSRPRVCEGAAITQAAYLAEKTAVRLHVCHISSALGVEALARGQRNGAAATGETCPQYLVLTDAAYDREDGAQFSVMPPLRSLEDQISLWQALREGTIGAVATDHCPFRRTQKRLRTSFEELPYGLPGVETLLPLLYSEGVAKRRLALSDLPRLLCEAPARIFGLWPQKGSLNAGADADIVILDPSARWRVTASEMHMQTDFSPYEDLDVEGSVVMTLSRGEVVFERGAARDVSRKGVFVPCVEYRAA